MSLDRLSNDLADLYRHRAIFRVLHWNLYSPRAGYRVVLIDVLVLPRDLLVLRADQRALPDIPSVPLLARRLLPAVELHFVLHDVFAPLL